MYKAASNGHLEMVRYMVKLGAKSYNNALHYAARKNHLEIVDYLISLSILLSLFLVIRILDHRSRGNLSCHLKGCIYFLRSKMNIFLLTRTMNKFGYKSVISNSYAGQENVCFRSISRPNHKTIYTLYEADFGSIRPFFCLGFIGYIAVMGQIFSLH